MSKMLTLNDLNETGVFLAKRYYNSKRIIWQPCRIISSIPTKNDNGFEIIHVQFLDGVTAKAFVNDNKLCDSRGSLTIQKIDNKWFDNEIKKLEDQKLVLQKQIDILVDAKNS